MTTEDIYKPLAGLDELQDRLNMMRDKLDQIELELEEVK